MTRVLQLGYGAGCCSSSESSAHDQNTDYVEVCLLAYNAFQPSHGEQQPLAATTLLAFALLCKLRALAVWALFEQHVHADLSMVAAANQLVNRPWLDMQGSRAHR